MRNLTNNGNQPRNPHFHSPSTCSKKSPQSTMNDATPAPPSHIQTSFRQRMPGKWHHDMPQHSAEPTTHQAFAPSAPILFSDKSMFATDAFIFSASAKAWKQRQIKAGVFIQGCTVQNVITEIWRAHDIS